MPSKQSYIDANSLSPKELAGLLEKISNNEIEYKKYLAYRTKKLSKAFKTVALRSYTHPNAICRLGYYYNSMKKWDALPLGEKYQSPQWSLKTLKKSYCDTQCMDISEELAALKLYDYIQSS